MRFNTVCLGGTFDHFHKGHREFLKTALLYGKKVIIGITSDNFVKSKKLSSQIELFQERKRAVLEFIKKEKALNRVETVKIDDLFGPTLSKDFRSEAIIVSKRARKGAGIINQERRKKGLGAFEIVVASDIFAQHRKLISSFRIRNGEINREGRLYINPLWLKNKLRLGDKLRGELKKPLGSVIKKNFKSKVGEKDFLATVGDLTTLKFNQLSLKVDLAVLDFKIQRKKKFSNLEELGFKGFEEVIKVSNPAGCLTSDLFRAVVQAIKISEGEKPAVIIISGEEDLAVLPLILALPLGAVVCYGQPGKRIVGVELSEEIKEKAYSMVSQFTRGY